MRLVPDELGFYHPENTEDVVELMNFAVKNNKQVRTCGAAHSQSWAIYTDPETDSRNVTNQERPPANTNQINVILNRMMSFEIVDLDKGLVRAGAGIHLGYDPSDVTRTSTKENSLLHQLWEVGLTVSELGGIIHQTLGGFISTGSAGGSLKYSFQDNIHAMTFVNGKGEVVTVSRDDPDQDMFEASMVAMGLFGILVSVDLVCEPRYNIVGQEAIVSYQECQFDFFGESKEKQSLEEFMRQIDYGRVNWWPQPGTERLIPWQAQRLPCIAGFTPSPYQEFTNFPQVAEPIINVIYMILGNYEQPERIQGLIKEACIDLNAALDGIIGRHLEELNKKLHLTKIIELLIAGFYVKVEQIVKENQDNIRDNLPDILRTVVGAFQGLDSEKLGMNKGTPQVFQDHAPWGLPMDNQASDSLLDIEFSELWFPIGRTNEVVQILRDYFEAPGSDQEKLKRTGLFTIEVYMAKACKGWMAMGHTDGNDEWAEGAFRFEPLWFVEFLEDPQKKFYPQFWNLFREKNIPFRLHWGKMLPDVTKGDPLGWVEFFRNQYPKWDDFLKVRQQMDPKQVFVSHYWRSQLGIS